MTDTNLAHASWRAWVAVATLGIGSFAIVTAELAPIGLLSQIGRDFSRSPQQVGLVVTLYAWIGAAAAIVSAIATGRMPRRPLLITLMLLLALSGAGAAMAASFGQLMVARIVGAVAHGAFWAMIGTLGSQLVPPSKVGLATSIIFGGVSAASVLGVPLANFLGAAQGWRVAFGCTAALALLVAASISLTIPPIKRIESVGTQAMARVLRNSRFQRIFVATLLSITAHFMAFTYIEPFLGETARISTGRIPILLFAFGAAGLLANALTGALIDRQLKSILTLSLVSASLALLILSVGGSSLSIWGTSAALILWGGAIAAVLVGLQTWILKEAGVDALPASAIYVALFNGAIGLGAITAQAQFCKFALCLEQPSSVLFRVCTGGEVHDHSSRNPGIDWYGFTFLGLPLQSRGNHFRRDEARVHGHYKHIVLPQFGRNDIA